MRITANGKPREVTEQSTVSELLRSLALPEQQVVVEHNGQPLPRDRYPHTRLRPDDRVEIAQMVGGG
ncbi:MAG: sulfur carrier protein ThiS [Candidatus Eremiobacteraeota bacterium]|nr:sulfur carrier protein ThiS [Candidatus Eremiobacteraeota bacterium]